MGISNATHEFKVDDNTHIRIFLAFLCSTKTNDLLTIYLARKIVQTCQSFVTTSTRLGIQSNQASGDYVIRTRSTHEEADTSIIYYAAELHKKNLSVHIYSPDTDVMVLALAKIQDLGDNTVIIMGSSQNRQWIPLLPIYHTLGDERVHALMGSHALSRSDITGRILGKSKSSWWAEFVQADVQVIRSLSRLGIGDKPTPDVLSHCE